MKILVSGLLNTETTTAVRGFPIDYYPIDYPFFGIDTAVSGVAYNIAKALKTLGDEVVLTAMTGSDFAAAYICRELKDLGIDSSRVLPKLQQTPASVVLYDPTGRRQIYCDLKDIQETPYDFDLTLLEGVDIVAACNINFNRPLISLARAAGKLVATDVHVMSNVYDDYNRDFLKAADILFLSDEGLGEDYREFIWQLAHTYPAKIIVLGRGGKGAAMYLREENSLEDYPANDFGQVVNTVGAGDALFSAFLHFFAKGCDPRQALYYAQGFAARKITVSGASRGFVTEEELLKM